MHKGEINRSSVTVALAAAAGMSAGPTPMVSAVASLFMTPLSTTFGLDRTTISAILLLSPLMVAIAAPFGGRMLDRFGVRPILLPAVVLFALANASMMLVSAVWHYVLLSLVISVCISVHCYSSYTKVLSLWFSRHRGVVTGITIAGGSALGASIIPQLVTPWIENYGWQRAYLGIAAIIAFWGLPILFFFFREPRADECAEPKAEGNEQSGELPGLSRKEAMRTGTFWMIAVAMFLTPFAIIGTLAHLFPMLTERGVSSGDAATTLSFIYIGGMIGQLSAGYLLDKISSPRIVLIYISGALMGVLLLHHSLNPAVLKPGAILLGLGQGAEMSVLAYLASRYFGLLNYGALYGRLYGFANLGIASGILLMGFVHDKAGNYGPMGYVLPVALLASLLLFGLLPKYRFARAGD